VPTYMSTRASLIVSQISIKDMFIFIKLFALDANYDEKFYKDLVEKLMSEGEIGGAAKILIDCNLYQYFDLLPMLK